MTPRRLPLVDSALVFCALGLLAIGAIRLAHAEPPADAADVSREAAGSFTASDGYCVQVASGGTAVELIAARPARITAPLLGEARHITVTHADATDSSTAACVLLGDDLGAALECDPENAGGNGASTGEVLTGLGQSITLHGRRTKAAGAVVGAWPTVWAEAAAGTVAVCVTLYR